MLKLLNSINILPKFKSFLEQEKKQVDLSSMTDLNSPSLMKTLLKKSYSGANKKQIHQKVESGLTRVHETRKDGKVCFTEYLGLKVLAQRNKNEENLFYLEKIDPRFSNFNLTLHGGITAAIFDSCMGYAAHHYANKREEGMSVLTKSIDKIDYFKPINLDDKLFITTKVVDCVQSTKHLTLQSYIFNDKNQLLARSSATFATLPYSDSAKKRHLENKVDFYNKKVEESKDQLMQYETHSAA